MKTTVQFYFDFISPYGWLAERRNSEIEKLGNATIEYIPLLFAGLLGVHGTKGPAEIPAKREFVFRDILRSAKLLGLEPKFPPTHPFNPLFPLRVTAAVPAAQRPQFAKKVFHLVWMEGRDVTSPPVLEAAAMEMGLPWPELSARALSEENKKALRDTTESAAKRGIFGVPTYQIGPDLFWGSDRTDHIIACAQGKLQLNEAEAKEKLSRPASAQRPG